MAIEPGDLRDIVTVEAPVYSQAASGQKTTTWTTLGTRRAQISPITGREIFAQSQVTALVTHRVRMRHWSAVHPRCRIVHRERVLNVEFVRDLDNRHWEMELLCTERID